MYRHKKQEQRVKRLLGFILAFVLMMPVLAETGLTYAWAEESSEKQKQYEQEGYVITCTIQSEWEAHQAVEITLQNTGEESIRDWAVRIEGTGTVTGLWNAQAVSEDENQTTVKNCGYNNVIGAGDAVTFGYTLEGENLSLPVGISLF